MRGTDHPGIWINTKNNNGLVPVFLASKKEFYYLDKYCVTEFIINWQPEKAFKLVAGEALVRWEDD